MSKMIVITLKEGTETSGHHGHRGRRGQVGGSLPSGRAPRQLSPAEELTRARNNMILRLAYNVQEDAARHFGVPTNAEVATNARRLSRQPIGEYLDGLAEEAINSLNGAASIDDIVSRELARGSLPTSYEDVRFDHTDAGPLETFLNAAFDAHSDNGTEAPAPTSSAVSTPDPRILGAMYDRLGHTTGPDANSHLREVMTIVNAPGSTLSDVNDAIDNYNNTLAANGVIRDSEAEQIRNIYYEARNNPEQARASYEALTHNRPIERTPQPAIDQILNTPAEAPATNYVTSNVAVQSNFRNNVQHLQDAYNDSTVKAMLVAAQNQTMERSTLNELITNEGRNNTVVAGLQDDLMKAYDFYHRATPYTSYFNSSDEVRDSIQRLQTAANQATQPEAATQMQQYILDSAMAHANGQTTLTRQRYEQRLNEWEAQHGQLTPILRARASALWDQTYVTGSSSSSTQRAQARREPAAPRRPVVPAINSTEDFDNYINTTINSSSSRTETMGYSALRAAVVNPESTMERVDATITDFDNTFPGVLSNEAKTAVKTAYGLYHAGATQIPAVVRLSGNVQEMVSKAKDHKLADELKASVHVKPLTIAAAVSNADLFGNANKVQQMNTVLRAATGNSNLDAVEFITDTYQDFEAGGLKVKLTDVSASDSAVSVEFNVYDNQGNFSGNGKRTLYASGEVHNDLLTLERRAQGSGFGSAFYKHTEDRYLKAGFKKVTIYANISGGGYSWAAMGFENKDGGFYPGTKVPEGYIRQLKSMYGRELPYIPKHMWELAAYTKPGYENTAPEDIPEEAKLGKQILRGENWHAEKYLNDSDPGFPIGQAYYNAHIHPTRARRNRRA